MLSATSHLSGQTGCTPGRYNWIFQYKFGADHWRIKLGTFPSLTCDEARKRAEFLRGQVADAKLGRGLHPALEREKQKHESKPRPKPQANALLTFIPVYLDAREGGLKQNTYEAQERHLNSHWEARTTWRFPRLPAAMSPRF